MNTKEQAEHTRLVHGRSCECLLCEVCDAYLAGENERAALRIETTCPECGCATPQDAARKECGCDGPVCSVSFDHTLATTFVRAVNDLVKAREALVQGEPYDQHACFTGDCAHDRTHDCIDTLREWQREVREAVTPEINRARAALGGEAAPSERAMLDAAGEHHENG